MEQTVATPIEEQVNGTPGMEYMQSTNTNTGAMRVNVTFQVGTNVHIAALNVQNRVGIATPSLPSVVSRLGLTVRARNPEYAHADGRLLAERDPQYHVSR